MLLESEPLEVTEGDILLGGGNQSTIVESGVQVVCYDVWIASALAVLNNETTGSICNQRSSLQLGLGLTIHDDHHITLEEALVAELSNSLQDVLVSVSTNLDVTSLCKARERTLVASPSSL